MPLARLQLGRLTGGERNYLSHGEMKKPLAPQFPLAEPAHPYPLYFLTLSCSPLSVDFPVSLGYNEVPADGAILCPAAPGVEVKPLSAPLTNAIALNHQTIPQPRFPGQSPPARKFLFGGDRTRQSLCGGCSLTYQQC